MSDRLKEALESTWYRPQTIGNTAKLRSFSFRLANVLG